MRTTLNIDDQLLDFAKHRAVEEKVPLARVIEGALREFLSKPKERSEAVHLVTVTGAGVKLGVDLDRGRSLLEIMDDLS